MCEKDLRPMEILIRNLSKKRIIPAGRLRKLSTDVMKTLLSRLPYSHPQVSLLFVDDTAMRRLNKKFRGVDRATDVLSFPMLEGKPSAGANDMPLPLGDIVISLEAARRQSADVGHSLCKEIALLLCHGFLHLLHYDDYEPSARRRMFAGQRRLMRRLEKTGIFRSEVGK
jgi:probable rRNA maturation factor